MTQDSLVQASAGEPSGGRVQQADDGTLGLLDFATLLVARWKLLILGSLAAGLAALGITYAIAPTFTARTVFLPPQQAQSTAALALASLGPLAGLAGGVGGVGTSGDRYVALMQSVTVTDRVIDQFKLMNLYEADFRVDARKQLSTHVRISLGRRDGLITVEADDKSPQRAADIANRYVDELRRMTGTIAVTEAQQRRAFFERHLQESRDRLAQAQTDLQASGFNAGALKAEPRAAADAYARLKADTTAAEMRLMLVRNSLADSTPEVTQQQLALAALRAQLAIAEKSSDSGGPDYVGKYREFKYQETLFEVYARQFELARADESREGALIQVVDPATPPERRSSPKRTLTAIVVTLVSGLALAVIVVARQMFRDRRRVAPHPGTG